MNEDRIERRPRPERPASRPASEMQRRRRGESGAAASTAERRRAAPPAARHTPQRRTRRRKSSAKARSRFAFGKVFGRAFVRRALVCVAAALALILIFVVCLRVKTISVVGNSMYSGEEIREAAGVTEGSALLLVNKTAVASRIRAELPYIDQVRVGVSLPNVVKVEVVELENTFAVAASDGSYWLINSSGRLVEQITAKAASDYLTIQGVRIENAQAGAQVQVMDDPPTPAPDTEKNPDDEEKPDNEEDKLDTPPEVPAAQRMEVALQIVSQLEEQEDIRSITAVDVSSVYDLEIWYGTRFEVKLGTTEELSYKLNYMLAAIAQLDSYQTGVLDLTFQTAKKATFIPWQN